jgi:hypothetical protein
MLLVMPPAEVTEAVSPVALKVWTRDSAASNRVQPAGFSLGPPETQWEGPRLLQSVSMLAASMLVESSIQR